MKKIALFLVSLFTATFAFAYDVEIDGIAYNFDHKNKTATVMPLSDSWWRWGGVYTQTEITIPEKVTYNEVEYSVTSIGENAFMHCSSLKSITMPNNVTSIGAKAFYHCYFLDSVTISNNNSSIGISAFEGCSSLTSITIPNSVTMIGDAAFQRCSSLTSITIPNSVTEIGSVAFNACSLTSITIPNSVTSIGYGAFAYCSFLTSITIGNSVTSIGESAFEGCSSLTSVTIPESVSDIGDYIFDIFNYSSIISINVDENNSKYASIDGILYDKNVTTLIRCPEGKTSVKIPNSITEIRGEAFYGCTGLTLIEIPDGVIEIGEYTFEDCENLRKIEIGASIQKIGESAFSGCNLVSLTIMSEMPPIVDEDTFDDIPSTLLVVVPYGSSKYYKSAEYWSDFTNYEEMSYLRTLWEKIKSFFGF